MAKTDVHVELYYSAAWNEITGDVYTRDPITITRGRQDEVSRISPSTMNLTIENRDGKYSPRNPTSPLYGLIGRNTPIRAFIRRITDTFSRNVSSGWGSADSGQPWTTSGGSASDFNVNGSVGQISFTTLNVGRDAILNTVSVRDADFTYTLTCPVTPTGDQFFTSLTLRRVSFNDRITANVQMKTSGSVVVNMQYVIAGVNTFFGEVTVSGVTATTPMRVRVQAKGTTFSCKVWDASTAEPATWTTSVQVPVVAPGGISFGAFLGSSVTNTLPVTFTFDNVVERNYRFHGEVESWPQRWNVKGNDVWAPIVANGIMRRLNAPGTTRADISALRRDILDSAVPAPVGYWPLEEGKDTPTPLPHNNLGLPGVVNYGPAYQPGQEGPTDTLSVYGVTAKGGSGTFFTKYARGVTLPVTPHTANGTEVVTLHVRWKPFDNPHVADGSTSADLNHRVEWSGGDIVATRILLQVTSSSMIVWANHWDVFYLPMGTPDNLTVSVPTLTDGNWHEIQVRTKQNGANIDSALWIDGVQGATNTITTKNVGTISEVVLGADGNYFNGSLSLFEAVYEASHITVHNTDTVGQFYQGMIGHAAETAATRITRLCAQDGIPITIVGDTTQSEPIGVQRVAPTLDLLQDAADAEQGILFETRDALGLTYRMQKSLYNQVPGLTVNYSAGSEVAPPLEPVEDTDITGNDITVTRYQGGRANAVKTTGTLNVQEPGADINGVGRYKKDYTLVLASDDQCIQLAGWLRHIGTWDEARFPVVNLDLTAMVEAGKTTLAQAAAALEIGDRLVISNPPTWLPPEAIEQHAQGFTEVLDSHRWTIAVNATPALPYEAYVIATGSGNRSRVPAAFGQTTLDGALNSSSTSVAIISTTVRWIDSATYGSQFPFDVLIGGERMTVTANAGGGLTQTFTVTRSVNGVVKAHASGTAVQLFHPSLIAL